MVSANFLVSICRWSGRNWEPTFSNVAGRKTTYFGEIGRVLKRKKRPSQTAKADNFAGMPIESGPPEGVPRDRQCAEAHDGLQEYSFHAKAATPRNPRARRPAKSPALYEKAMVHLYCHVPVPVITNHEIGRRVRVAHKLDAGHCRRGVICDPQRAAGVADIGDVFLVDDVA
jgi:hypothetical protein